MGWLGTWANRKKIDLDSALIGASLSNVPVPLNVTLSEIFTELGANKLKIAVTTEDGTTQLPVEVAFWDNSNNRALLFVKMALVADTTKTLYFYFDNLQSDNTTYVGAPGTTIAESVWSEDGDRIYHLNEDYANLITNGDFSDDETGWTYASGIIHSIVSGRQFIDRNGQAYADHAYQSFPTVNGESYRWYCYVHLVSHVADIIINGSTVAQVTTSSDGAMFTGTFTATQASTVFAIRASSSTQAEVTFDNVFIIKEDLFVESAGVAGGAYPRYYLADPQANVLGAKGVDLSDDEIIFPTITTGLAHSVLFVTKRQLVVSPHEHILSGAAAGSRLHFSNLTNINYQTISGIVSLAHGVTDSDDHVFLLTKNGTAVKLYVDGILEDTKTGYNETNDYHNIGGKDFTSSIEFLVEPIGELWILDSEMSADWAETISEALLDNLATWTTEEEPEAGITGIFANEVIHSALFGGLVVR